MVSTLFMMLALLALLGAYVQATKVELKTTGYSGKSTRGFYAAEAGLNVRAEEVRNIFIGYNRPSGTAPLADDPCIGTNQGSGDYACKSYSFDNQTVYTYLTEDPSNPINTRIPPGELYQNLNAQEYRYTAFSRAIDKEGRLTANLELRFKSRLVPLFQFTAFYDKDLEILPGPTMNLSGPIHTNGDLYLNANTALNIDGQVSTAGRLFRGRKNNNTCKAKPVTVKDPAVPKALVPGCSVRTEVGKSDVAAWNGMIMIGVDEIAVPEPEALDPEPGQVYWDKADLRLVLRLTDPGNNIDTTYSPTGVEVRKADNSVDTAATNNLHSASCPGQINGRAVGVKTPSDANPFYNNREGKFIRLLEVDLQALLNCLHLKNIMEGAKTLDDDSEGGLVFHLSIDGPDATSAANSYGVRIRNAAELAANVPGAPEIKGLTIVTDQAIYTLGDYNAINWKPAAILADSFNVLSNSWSDSNSQLTLSSRVASDTTVYTAVLAGTDSTGNLEGTGGQDLGSYNGGLENYPRFHEKWSGKTLFYLGSFVSLNTPRHVNGAWVYGSPQYTAPNRNWDYDTRFNDASNLPPLSPRFVYLKQELFVRDFEN
ncbi:MAG: hypothetical protein D6719_13375 [Candidatus Dadabacteria bacterium]|nr:MAG: hypothetical protein D6719_13375 [Candidatus Dadabacteria bacterium]